MGQFAKKYGCQKKQMDNTQMQPPLYNTTQEERGCNKTRGSKELTYQATNTGIYLTHIIYTKKKSHSRKIIVLDERQLGNDYY